MGPAEHANVNRPIAGNRREGRPHHVQDEVAMPLPLHLSNRCVLSRKLQGEFGNTSDVTVCIGCCNTSHVTVPVPCE